MSKNLYLSTNGLTKDFGNHKGAFDISIKVKPGEIVGFIGPNGAGKTTTMRSIMGFIQPDKGDVVLLDELIESDRDRVELLSEIGYLPSDAEYYPSLTARKFLAYTEELQGGDLSERIDELAEKLDLDLNKKMSQLSTGNKRKVGVINCLIHDPKLIILDEPTSGLDPLIQKKVLQLLQEAADNGAAILLSSHVLSEVEQICDHIVMIKDGKIILEDTTKEILSRALRRIRVSGIDSKLEKQLEAIKEIEKIEHVGDFHIVYIADPQPIVEILVKNGIYNFYSERPTLEEMFIDQYK